MRTILSMILLMGGTLSAQMNPKMRVNFGASSTICRFSLGYFNNPAPVKIQGLEQKPDSINSLMHSGARFDFEAMTMVNNRYQFSEQVMRNAPRFITLRFNYDGFMHQALGAVGFAQGLSCRTYLPIFGQVKGYWGLGAAFRYMAGPYGEIVDAKSMMGGRASLNVYNRYSAMQAEVFAYRNAVYVTTMIHKKVGQHFLVDFGAANNQAKAGLSVMMGSCRLGISTQWHKHSFQSGVNFTANL